jgi:hypothetical protein
MSLVFVDRDRDPGSFEFEDALGSIALAVIRLAVWDSGLS